MGWAVYTTDGVLVFKPVGEGNPQMTQEQAEASVQERQKRATDMGLKVVYEAREVAA